VSEAPYEVLDPRVLEQLVVPSNRYEVVSVTQNQEVSPTNQLIDALEIVFTVTGRPGVFTVTIPLTTWRIFESGIELDSAVDEVEAIYAL
jgi:hypothetical protein